MKKTHITLIVLLTALLAGCMTYGGLHLYADRSALPQDTRIGGLQLGGMDRQQAVQLVQAKLKELEQLPLHLEDDEQAVDMKLTLGTVGVSYHADAFFTAVEKLGQGHLWERVQARRSFGASWDIDVHMEPETLNTLLDQDWEERRYGHPVDAVRQITSNDEVRYIPEKSVYRLDRTRLIRELGQQLPRDFKVLDHADIKELSLKLPLSRLEPKRTVESLKQEGIERRIVQFSTSLGSSSTGRVHNVQAAAKTVDGMILRPDEVFDYAKVIADAESKYGFREAPVIVSGRLEPGIGGGICQVSSTLYHAALQTGLNIVERRNHSLPVSYLPRGQDATFATGSINFRFKNNTGKHLLLRANVESGQLVVKFFGTFPKEITYQIESKTVSTISIPDSYVQNNSLLPGQSQVLIPGKPGYVVETYRTKLVHGKTVERETISRDTYRAQKRVIARNSHASKGTPRLEEPRTEEAPLVEDGVRSQQ
ncbi:Vancomycin B-type resistance protein VanW [compost metagenome]